MTCPQHDPFRELDERAKSAREWVLLLLESWEISPLAKLMSGTLRVLHNANRDLERLTQITNDLRRGKQN